MGIETVVFNLFWWSLVSFCIYSVTGDMPSLVKNFLFVIHYHPLSQQLQPWGFLMWVIDSLALSTFGYWYGLSSAPICPCCRQADHSTQHLFSCPEHATDLSTLDLWGRPRETAEFLQTWPFFKQIRQERPPLEPPPTQWRLERGLWWWCWNIATNLDEIKYTFASVRW